MLPNTQPKLIFRADGDSEIGTGHLMRCLALAQTWIDLGGSAILATTPGSYEIEQKYKKEQITVDHIFSVPGSEEDADEIISIAQKYSSKWIIIDGYHFNEDYFLLLKKNDLKIVLIDDLGQKIPYFIDIVVNPNIYATNLYREGLSNRTVLLGPEYYPIRREFIQSCNYSREFKKSTIHALVTMGGSDPKNYTLKFIKALENCNFNKIEVIVLIGPHNKNYIELMNEAKKVNFKIQLIENPLNIPELMIWADIGISSAGTTTYELAFMMLPSFLMRIADNQILNIKAFSEIGIFDIINDRELLDPKNLCQKIFEWYENPDIREKKSLRLSALVDGYGSERIFAHIENSLVIRPVREEDCERIWKWANDPHVREFSFNSSPISIEDHRRWFQEKIRNKNCKFYIIMSNNNPIAQTRFDIENKHAIISIVIDDLFRGKGYGERIIRMACGYLFRRTQIESIHASVLVDNSASIKVFTRAGFKINSNTVNNRGAIEFVLKKDDDHV